MEKVFMDENSSDQNLKCSNCNAEVTPGTRFCTECGTPVEEVIVKDDSDMQPPSLEEIGDDEGQDKKAICPKCYTEVPSGMRFCTECGTKVEAVPSSTQPTVCPKCYADVPSGVRFCTECGTKIEAAVNSTQETICPKCYTEVPPGTQFCTECGTKIGQVTLNQSTCPKCYADVAPGVRFCTECGTSLEAKTKTGPTSSDISRELKKRREEKGTIITPETEDAVESVMESGKGFMKGVGGFLNKASSSLEDNLNNLSGSSKATPSSSDINLKLKKRREMKKINPGYLVCDSCGSYYQLQPGENPDDFSDECDCGGRLNHKESLPDS